jgi:hypothetical protein
LQAGTSQTDILCKKCKRATGNKLTLLHWLNRQQKRRTQRLFLLVIRANPPESFA